MELQVTELALDHQDAGLRLGVLEHDVGQRLDVEPGRDLYHPSGHPRPGEAAANPRAEVTHRLRLQLGDEDGGAELGHGYLRTTSRSSSRMSRRRSSRDRPGCSGEPSAAGGAGAGAEAGACAGSPNQGCKPVKSPNGSAGSEL